MTSIQKCEVHTTVRVVWLHTIGVRAFSWCAVHCGIFRNNPESFNIGRECIAGYVTTEMDRAIAINIMTTTN